MDLNPQWTPPQPSEPMTATVDAPRTRGIDVLRETFNRLTQAENLRLAGKLDAAQTMCEDLIRQYPDYWAAVHTLGLVHIDKKDHEQALNYLVRAAMLDPRSWSTLTALAAVYLALGATERAARTLEEAIAINPREAAILSTLGGIYREESEYELASNAFQSALALDADDVRAELGLGWVSLYMGHNAESAAVFTRLLEQGLDRLERIEPAAPLDVLLAFAILPPALVHVDVLSELDKLMSKHQPNPDLDTRAAFVRVMALDRAGRHQEAWEHALPANLTMLSELRDDLRRSREREQATLSFLRDNPIETTAGNDDHKYPISLFILGPSRSGKTSVERLVATLEGAKRGYENPIVEIAVRRAFQSANLLNNNYFELLPPKLYSLCREIYLEQLVRRAGSAKALTNTAPGRIAIAGLLAATFPNVRFICVKRNLEDTILRMFQYAYRNGNSYAYDLKAARDHVIWYHRMIDLLAEKLPDTVRVIQYEDMVADPAAALQTAANLCGLPVPSGPIPAAGDDRGCAEPYRKFMAAELAG